MARSPSTCLTSNDHGYDIDDYLSHCLGCLDYWERSNFFNADNKIWTKEVKHYMDLGKTRSEAQTLSDEKRSQWEKNYRKELRRIKFLRQTLEKDDKDKHLMDKIKSSGMGWRASKEYEDNIEKVRIWRSDKGLKNGSPELQSPGTANIGQQETTHKGEYDPEWDINAPVIQFEGGKLKNVDRSQYNGISGSVPDQKIKVKNLLAELKDNVGQRNILHKDNFPDKVTYFHLPSNNMAVSPTSS